MGGLALALLALFASAVAPAASAAPPAAAAPPPASLAELEGRGPARPGALAGEVGAGAPVLRFTSPAGGRAELVVYLAARPARAGLELAEGAALASLLGVPGEVRLEAGRLRARIDLPPVDAGPEPVPEPAPWVLVGLGLATLAAACHPAGPWKRRLGS